MTLRQYLAHLKSWLVMFPRFSNDDHLWVGTMGSGTYDCRICHASRHEPDDELSPEELEELRAEIRASLEGE